MRNIKVKKKIFLNLDLQRSEPFLMHQLHFRKKILMKNLHFSKKSIRSLKIIMTIFAENETQNHAQNLFYSVSPIKILGSFQTFKNNNKWNNNRWIISDTQFAFSNHLTRLIDLIFTLFHTWAKMISSNKIILFTLSYKNFCSCRTFKK